MPILEIDGVGRVEVGSEFLKLSPEQQEATVNEIASASQPKAKPAAAAPQVGTAEDMLRSADAGLASGIGALIGLPGTAAEWGATALDKAAQYIGGKIGVDAARPEPKRDGFVLPRIEDVHAEMQANKPFYKPQTTAGQYAKTVGEFIPGSVVAPGGMIANALKFGVVPGAASEAAGQATAGTSYEAPARIGAALAAGGVAAVAGRPGRAAEAIRQQLPEGVTPQMVDQAELLITDAARQGIQLSWPEALSQVAGRPVLTNVLRHLEAAPSSEGRMAEFFGGRAPAVERSAGPVFDSVTPAAPNPSGIGPAVGVAAERTIDDVRGVINRASDPFYRASETIRLSPQEFAQARALPGYQEAVQTIRGTPQLARYVQGMPEDSIGFLNEVKKQLDASAAGARSPMTTNPNMQIPAGYGMDATAARDIGVNASRRAPGNPYEIALNVQSQLREQYLQPLLDGPLGKLAARDTQTKKAIEALFPNNPLPNSADEIATTVGAVAQRNPYAARSLVRAHIEMTFNEATQALQSGANQAGGAKFRSIVAGNTQQSANLEAAIRALPNGDRVWPGVQRWFDVLEATGTRQNIGSRTAYNTEFMREQSASRLGGEAMKVGANPLKGVQFLADRYERWQLGQNLDGLAAVLTDPRSARYLRDIASLPVNSPTARNLAVRVAELSESATAPRSYQVDQPRK